MSFFENFPTVQYYFSETDPNTYTLRHIIRRFKVNDVVKRNVLTYQTYIISDGESPDIVANKVYGKPDWHWVILMYNDIVNTMAQWPKPHRQVIKYASEKYNVSRLATFALGSEVLTVDDSTKVFVGASLTGVGVPTNLYVVSVSGNLITLNTPSVISGTKTVKFDTMSDVHHVTNSKGIVVDLSVYTGTDLQYVRNIDYETALNDKHRMIKLPLKVHAEKIVAEASTILKGS